jgi:hypothetical protein
MSYDYPRFIVVSEVLRGRNKKKSILRTVDARFITGINEALDDTVFITLDDEVIHVVDSFADVVSKAIAALDTFS